jgi:hypothetical protein
VRELDIASTSNNDDIITFIAYQISEIRSSKHNRWLSLASDWAGDNANEWLSLASDWPGNDAIWVLATHAALHICMHQQQLLSLTALTQRALCKILDERIYVGALDSFYLTALEPIGD